ncbi:MAG: carboxypeptidase regulatory-like domain-containing protein [Bryobacterales bacterium]|nr:carboxypeptidase regulatory-like domain-containing protein [Bryobacterales bacterium]
MRFCLGLLAFALLSAIAYAQTSAGAIVGVVRDPTGGTIPDARIVVTNTGTNVAFRTATQTTGDYFVPALIPGTYRVEAEKQGFKKVTAESLVVAVSQTLRVDLTMPVGDVAESVSVVGEAPLIQTDQATLGQVVNNRAVTELPLNGRDFTSLLRLNTGVTEVQGGITTATTIRRHGLNDAFRNVSVNGARPASISYLIDGVSSNDGLFQTPVVTPPVDIIEEFKLQNALYSAEFGMGAGQVNVALKSGANAYHGSAWEFLRNDALQPANPKLHIKSPLKQNQFGFAFGGPIEIPKIYRGKDKTFFFGSYQGGRRRTTSTGQTQVPSEKQRNGDFSDWPTQLFDPLTSVAAPGQTPAVTRSPFAQNRIPTSRFAPQSVNALKYFPTANVACPAFPCTNLLTQVTNPVTIDGYSLRVDHNLGTKDRIFGQFLFQDEQAPQKSIIPLSGNDVQQRGRLVGLQWNHIFSPRVINEFRAGFARQWFFQGYETAFGGVNYWKEIGLNNLVDKPEYYALPGFVPGTNYTSIGFTGTAPFYTVTNTFHWVDGLSITMGRHSIKIGADIRRNRYHRASGGQGGPGLMWFNGSYTARNPLLPQAAGRVDTGNGMADLLLGYLNFSGATAAMFRGYDNPVARLRSTDFMPYFQDDFRVTANLTLNIGLRWELHTPFKDINRGGSLADLTYPGGRILYRDKGYTELVNNPILAACCAPDTLIPTDYKAFAPRIGFAWRPLANNRLVVRGGYGIFYDVLHNYYPTGSISENVPFLTPTLPNPTGAEVTPPLDIRNLFPAPYSIAQRKFPTPYCQAPSSNVIDPITGINTEVRNFCPGGGGQLSSNRTPYTQQWGFNLQWQARQGMLVELGYQGSHSLRQPIQWVYNMADLPTETGNANNSATFRSDCPAGTYPTRCSPIQDRVPYLNFARNSATNANILQAVYHAMTAKVEHRFSNGLQMLASFTYGKAIDQFSEIQNVGGAISSIAQYGRRFDLERALANYDQRRRLVMNWVYELPIGRGKALFGGLNRPLDAVFGGWQVAGIVMLADGTPLTVGCFCGDRAQIGNTFNVHRMDQVKDPIPDSFEPTLTRQFDTTAFVTPALGMLGTSGRNTVLSTGQRAGDASASKSFRITESVKVQFRAEFYNLLASYRYSPRFPNNNATAPNFGSLLPVNGDKGDIFSPRVIQLGLRLAF